jgi:hypothetical protein
MLIHQRSTETDYRRDSRPLGRRISVEELCIFMHTTKWITAVVVDQNWPVVFFVSREWPW